MTINHDDQILSNSSYNEQSIFKYDAIAGMSALSIHPFHEEGEGTFLYLTNRKYEKYSYLFDEDLDEHKVFHNCTLQAGYTALLICKKIEYFENTEFPFTNLELSYSNQTERLRNGSSLEGKFCIFQNPLNKLVSYASNDIIEVYESYPKAYKVAKKLSRQTSVLLTQVMSHIDWH